ncbi:alpha/beta fold hydrolase [Gordonia soli]|nr:alpha/beta fold hydrolase [Gordonia soli]
MSTARSVDVDGVGIAWYLTGPEVADHRPLLLVGLPMDASGFATLSSHFDDRTVITYDPRGAAGSVDGSSAPLSIDTHATDLRRVLEAADVGVVDVFASSGGAVTMLALLAQAPHLVGTVVLHEPPLTTVLPDRVAATAVVDEIAAIYRDHGFGPAMAAFIAAGGHLGEFPDGWSPTSGPSAADLGLPTDDDGSRDDVMFARTLYASTGHEPDLEPLAEIAGVIVASGEESQGQLMARAAHALADATGWPHEMFPSHHDGFLGGEFGQHGAPAEFAARLRELLDGS